MSGIACRARNSLLLSECMREMQVVWNARSRTPN